VVIGGLNPVHNAVNVAELAIEKGATTLPVPVSAGEPARRRRSSGATPDPWRHKKVTGAKCGRAVKLLFAVNIHQIE
jgi:hypothetical protein